MSTRSRQDRRHRSTERTLTRSSIAMTGAVLAPCKRVSTDQQSTARQKFVLDEAGIEVPVVFEEDQGTSSRLHPLPRPKFRELLNYARPGDTVRRLSRRHDLSIFEDAAAASRAVGDRAVHNRPHPTEC
ncbi:recombinase family protein [Streptomyces sp. NPDC005303]|uniref:recombinase family protein n=1 Tax=Streptomyces sp. NPDC005303 TaxID=3155713 RepID=UPI0033BFA742